MFQEESNESQSGQDAWLELCRAGRFVSERDPAVGDVDDSPVAEGHAMHIGAEVFQRPSPVANRCAIDNPFLAPHVVGNVVIKFQLFQAIA